MVSRESLEIWKDIRKRKPEEQKHLLRWQLQAREPIRRLSDMKPGDHLLMTRNLGSSLEYAHHFLCSGIDEISGKPTIIHYYNTPGNAMKQLFPTSLGSGSCLEQLGEIQQATLPDGDLIAKNDVDSETDLLRVEVERVVWPDELRQYSTEEVIARALTRMNEKYYHLTNNNCESFVMWCLCDLNISLQVTQTRKAFCETGSATIRTLWHGLQQLPKVGAEIWDDIAAAAAGRAVGNAFSKLGISIGVVTTVVVETIIAIVDIREEYKKWRSGVLVKTRKEFIAEVVDKVLLALFRSGGSIAGMIAGQILIPVPVVGGLVGALIGMFGGHLVEKGFSAQTKEAFGQAIDTLIDKFDEMKAKLKAHSHKFE
ncbi:uncharacterized protein [Pocillopora verrucosa]|uniref:uncharacterized protein n=1 Tax=Pocillopora verrucosa TaxID=203993 RepID=UPI0033409E57